MYSEEEMIAFDIFIDLTTLVGDEYEVFTDYIDGRILIEYRKHTEKEGKKLTLPFSWKLKEFDVLEKTVNIISKHIRE